MENDYRPEDFANRIGLDRALLLARHRSDGRPVWHSAARCWIDLFAIHIVSVQWYLSDYNVFTVAILIVCAATVSTLFLWFITDATWFIPTPIGWIAILFQGIVTTFIGQVLTYQAIGISGAGSMRFGSV